jgi:tetratricopeptide (TPR) repeat protein
MRPILLRAALLSVFLPAWACTGADAPSPQSDASEDGPAATAAAPEPLPDGAQARSLLGGVLYPPSLPPEVRERYETRLAEARAAWERTPENADSLVWLGRRTAYLGDYREAIRIYGEGLELHPDDARFLRHRGHRWISLREFDRAIADLQAAAELVAGREDRVEPDGLPNALGIPTSTLHFNIWYHLGLAHYLEGEYEQALLAWNECLAVSRHPDSVVATTYWLNNTLRRLALTEAKPGLAERADALLEAISPEMGIIESTSYLDVLLVHKGERTVEEILASAGGEGALASTTTLYGVGMWHLVKGFSEPARQFFMQATEDPSQWAAFGYIAAEAELAR